MGLMDQDTQHRPMRLTSRAHELKTVRRYNLLVVTVNDKHNGRLLTTPYTRKYATRAVFDMGPTHTRTNIHNPLILMPHPPRIHCLHASDRLGSQQPSTFTSTSSRDSCAT